MREGMYIVDGDGHVMDFPRRCYQNIFPSSTAGGSPSSRAPSGTAARPPTASSGATPTRRKR
jgi:hypothetical protein